MDNSKFVEWKWNAHMDRSVHEALAEVEREAQVRSRCYDRWINEGRISRVDAWDRQERLLSAVKILREVSGAETASPDNVVPVETGTVELDRAF